MTEVNKFKANIDALMDGLKGFLSTKTVVGEPMDVNGTIIIPLADVSFGMAAGAADGDNTNRVGGGMGAKITPSAMLVINENGSRMISVKDDSGIFGKILDMAPDIIAKFTKKNEGDPVKDLFDEED